MKTSASSLNKISGWLKVNKLSLNAKKSKFMIFKHVNKTVEPLSLKIENTNIERVTNFNFLGLTISDNLEWKTHVQKIANKCSRTTGILNKLKHILQSRPSTTRLVIRRIGCSAVDRASRFFCRQGGMCVEIMVNNVTVILVVRDTYKINTTSTSTYGTHTE